MATKFTIQKGKDGTTLIVWVNGEITDRVDFTKREDSMIDKKIEELTDFYGEAEIKYLN